MYMLTPILYPWTRQWHPTPVCLPVKSHGRRNLEGYSPRAWEESDTTEWLHFHFSLSGIGEGNGNPLQCSCLENPRDGGSWWAAVYGVAQSDISDLAAAAAAAAYSILNNKILFFLETYQVSLCMVFHYMVLDYFSYFTFYRLLKRNHILPS